MLSGWRAGLPLLSIPSASVIHDPILQIKRPCGDSAYSTLCLPYTQYVLATILSTDSVAKSVCSLNSGPKIDGVKRIILPFAVILPLIVACGNPAVAGTILVVPPEAPSYLINPSATSVDVLEAFIEAPAGATFDSPGFSNLDAGWTAITVNPTYAVEYGPPSSSLTEDLNVIGSPLTVDFYAFTACASST